MTSTFPATPASTEMGIAHVSRHSSARTLLDLFFPVHYAVGMKVEDTLRSSEMLNRHQAVILWLIRSEGQDGMAMRRKYIESVMASWYDISSSTISKTIRALAKPPLSLITIEEHPQSAREKLITLTPVGKDFTQKMVENGTALCTWYLDKMSERAADVDICLYIFSKVNAIFDRVIEAEKLEKNELSQRHISSESVLRHPLSSSFIEQSYSQDQIPHIPEEYAALMQLDVFFPIQYKAGNRLEEVLRSGVALSRQQVIVLWIIAAEGVDGKGMRRKSIETAMRDWLEINSSSISKAIRSLTVSPLDLLTLEEHPESGREKLVQLNAKGESFVQQMFDNGTRFLEQVIDHLSDDEIDMVIHIFARTSQIFEHFPGPFRSAQPLPQLRHQEPHRLSSEPLLDPLGAS